MQIVHAELPDSLSKILNQATRLNQAQKAWIENHWRSQNILPIAPKENLSLKVLSNLIPLMVAACFIGSLWYPRLLPICNVIAVILWVLLILILPIMSILAFLGVCTMRADKDDEKRMSLLSPGWIKHLQRFGLFKKIHSIFIPFLLIASVASAGFMITAIMLTLALLVSTACMVMMKSAIHKTVTEIAD